MHDEFFKRFNVISTMKNVLEALWKWKKTFVTEVNVCSTVGCTEKSYAFQN